MKSLIAALLLTTASLSSFAQTPATPGVDKREAKHEQRIEVNLTQFMPKILD